MIAPLMIAMDLARNRGSSHVVTAPMALMLIPLMVLLAILVPSTLWAMVTGGPRLDPSREAGR